MTNTRDENKIQSNNIKDETEKLSDQQKQQLDNITSDVSDTTNKFNENINKYQKRSKEIIEKSIDTTSNYQQQATTNNKPLIHSNQSQTPL